MLNKIEALKVSVDVNTHHIFCLIFASVLVLAASFQPALPSPQGHVIFLACAIREYRNLIQDTVKNLLGRLPSAGGKEVLESLLSPQFAIATFCFDDSVSAGHQDVAIFQTKYLRVVARVFEQTNGCTSGLQPEHPAMTILAADHERRIQASIDICQRSSRGIIFRIKERGKELDR
jgi:hypothetical protein